MYVELVTRVAIQKLEDDEGTEEAALNSIYQLFPITREILKRHGRDAEEFAKLALLILNKIIRPFTAKWHKILKENAFKDVIIKKSLEKSLKSYKKFYKHIQKCLQIWQGSKI